MAMVTQIYDYAACYQCFSIYGGQQLSFKNFDFLVKIICSHLNIHDITYTIEILRNKNWCNLRSKTSLLANEKQKMKKCP